MTPYEQDQELCQIAEKMNCQIIRSESITVTDLDALRAQNLTKGSPDYAAIRRLLNKGKTVEGIETGDVEYVLRKRPEEKKHGSTSFGSIKGDDEPSPNGHTTESEDEAH